MDIKQLADFYLWMVENEYNHNIRLRVEQKAEMYLKELKERQKKMLIEMMQEDEDYGFYD